MVKPMMDGSNRMKGPNVLPTLKADVEAKPSDLQSDYRRLLDLVEEGTSVIIRQRGGKPPITLIKNESWREAMIARAWLSMLSALVRYAVGRAQGSEANVCPTEFAWLELYEDYNDVRAFVDELSGSIMSAVNKTQTWDDVAAVVDEWSRSASLLEHADLVARFRKTKEKPTLDTPHSSS